MAQIRKYLLRYRAYGWALIFSVVIWLTSAMSEVRSYESVVRVQWVGFDTARYVMAASDNQLRVTINSNGFSALRNHATLSSQPFLLSAATDTPVFVSDDLQTLVSQLGLPGVRGIETRQETLSLSLNERQSRAYVPQIRHLKLSFVEQYGLYGTPRLSPDTVWLYGSKESLDKVLEIETVDATFSDIGETSTYTVALKPVWKQYPDLRVSAQEVSLEIPTTIYSEHSYVLPIQLQGLRSNDSVRIYPEQAQVTFWMASQGDHKLASDMFRLSADFEHRDSASDRMPIRVANFPDFVRIKQIEPSEVRYVVIK